MKKRHKLMLGDNITELKKLPENSIDSIVTDPPYGLSFMNKKWDYDVPSVEFWLEIYRVLKPGGHILSFGGTRTYHRMVVNMEDAGFEIRDQIMWLYGSGFPKSHNIGKAVDKLEGNEREIVGDNPNHRTTAGLLELGFQDGKESSTITKGQSEFEGWGTALKPANEPICLARKPLSEKSVAENVLKWRVGGINVDDCRIGFSDNDSYAKMKGGVVEGKQSGVMYHNYDRDTKPATGHKQKIMVKNDEGRFPANIILDEIAAEILDQQSGILKSGAMNGEYHNTIYTNDPGNRNGQKIQLTTKANSGGASRFFYNAKVSKKERNMGLDHFDEKEKKYNQFNSENRIVGDKVTKNPITSKAKNIHPTVKPVSLMAYLCRLVTPPNGIVLDPFVGSGSTGVSALLEGFRFIGIEMNSEYLEIAQARIENFELYREFLNKN